MRNPDSSKKYNMNAHYFVAFTVFFAELHNLGDIMANYAVCLR
jgi:hypothetical protein